MAPVLIIPVADDPIAIIMKTCGCNSILHLKNSILNNNNPLELQIFKEGKRFPAVESGFYTRNIILILRSFVNIYSLKLMCQTIILITWS